MKASLLPALQTVYTFLPKLCIAKQKRFYSFEQNIRIIYKKITLKKELKRDFNILRKLWLPNKKGRKAECKGGQSPCPSHNFSPCYFKNNEVSVSKVPFLAAIIGGTNRV